MAGAIEVEGECPVCFYHGPQLVGYIGIECTKCHKVTSSDSANLTVRYRREFLGYDRDEMARQCGVMRETVAKYEEWWPPETYWLLTKKMVQERINQPEAPR